MQLFRIYAKSIDGMYNNNNFNNKTYISKHSTNIDYLKHMEIKFYRKLRGNYV